MNRTQKITLAILGGIDVTVYMFTPIIIAALWITLTNTTAWQTNFFYGIGLLSTLFRAIKIGFLK